MRLQGEKTLSIEQSGSYGIEKEGRSEDGPSTLHDEFSIGRPDDAENNNNLSEAGFFSVTSSQITSHTYTDITNTKDLSEEQ